MSTFDDVRLPEDIEQGAQGGPGLQTSIITLSSGVEQRIANWSQARAKWNIGYGIMSDVELAPVEQFFYERGGRLHSFRFKDFHDFTATNQTMGVGDGVTRTFLMYKQYGTYNRRITRPVTGTVSIYVDGTLADPTTYDLTIAGGYVKFHTGHVPGNLLVVSATFEFDVPVRFDVDDLALTIYWVKAGQAPTLPIIEVRDIINASPTVALTNPVTTLGDDTSTASHIRVADVVVTDDPFGDNVLTLSGADAAFFELVGTLTVDGTGVSVYLKAGTSLDGSIKSSYAFTVNVSDSSIGVSSSASQTLAITQTARAPRVALSNLNASFAWNQSVAAPIVVATITVTQHGSLGTNVLSLSGADAASFTINPPTSSAGGFTSTLSINAGVTTPVDSNPAHAVHYTVNVDVSNAGFASPPQGTAPLVVYFGVAPGTTTDDTPGTRGYTVPEYQTLVIEGWGGGAGASGVNAVGHDGTATSIAAMSLLANGGEVAPLTLGADYDTEGGPGGTASGGDENTSGGPGGVGFFKKQPVSSSVSSGAGGTSPHGGTPGAAVTATAPTAPDPISQPSPPADSSDTAAYTSGIAGTTPGAGGSGAAAMLYRLVLTLADGYTWTLYAQARPGAGGGGYFKKTFVRSVTPGAPTPGAVITYTVGSKGLGGLDSGNGGDGAAARIKFTVT